MVFWLILEVIEDVDIRRDHSGKLLYKFLYTLCQSCPMSNVKCDRVFICSFVLSVVFRYTFNPRG